MTNIIGQSFGRYHILEQLGEGGMAVVYKAYDTRLERDVAVKVIRTENLPQNGVEKALKRFEREAKTLAKLTHPNIVPITDYGEHDGKPYLVMPFLSSGTLKQRLGKPIPAEEAVRVLIPIARALQYAHQQGIIHRDVKPANILITSDGEPMLTDFGIAKILDAEETLDLTGTNAAMGTPEYMAPEQAMAKTADHRADIYALGIVLYEMVTGRKPYSADTPMALMIMHARDPLPRPSQYVSNLPDGVEKVLLKALAKEPVNRYQNAAEMANAMEKLAAGSLVHGQSKRKVKLNSSQKPIEEITTSAFKENGPNNNVRLLVLGSWKRAFSFVAIIVMAGTILWLRFSPNMSIAQQSSRVSSGLPIENTSSFPNVPAKVNPVTPISTLTLEPTSILEMPATAAGSAYLQPSVAISLSNVAQIKLLAQQHVQKEGQSLGIFQWVTDVDFSSNGKYLAVASPKGTYMLNAQTLEILYRFESGKWTNSVRFSPDGALLATGDATGDNIVRLYSVKDGSLIRSLEGHTNEITALGFSPDGSILATGSQDRSVLLWNVTNGSLIRKLEGSTEWITSIAFSPDGKTLAIGLGAAIARLYLVSDGSYIGTLGGQSAWVTGVKFSPDGSILAVASGDYSIRLWHIPDNSLIRVLTGSESGFAAANSIAFSPDGTILTSGSNGKIQFWQVSEGTLLKTLNIDNESVGSLIFSPDGTILVSAPKYEGQIRLWGITQ